MAAFPWWRYSAQGLVSQEEAFPDTLPPAEIQSAHCSLLSDLRGHHTLLGLPCLLSTYLSAPSVQEHLHSRPNSKTASLTNSIHAVKRVYTLKDFKRIRGVLVVLCQHDIRQYHLERGTLNLKIPPQDWPEEKFTVHFPWLKTETGGHMPLWVVLPLGWWSCVL